MGRERPVVLVVDDQDFFHVWIKDALDGLYRVVAAADSSEALRALKRQRISAILLDVILGTENGLDLVEQFRTISHAPIFVVTGHSDEEVAIRAANLRVTGYFKKPLSQADIHAKLIQVVPVDPIDHATAFIETHFIEDLNALDIAERVGISEGHLRAGYLRVHGYTPMHYLRYVRLREAERLLLETSREIGHISHEVGYGNAERFRRTFLSAFRMSPSEYRARGSNKNGGRETNENDGSFHNKAD